MNKKIYTRKTCMTLLALLLAFVCVFSSCVKRKSGGEVDTTTDEQGTEEGEIKEGEVIYREYDDHFEVTGCEGDAYALVIKSEINGKKVTKIAEGAFRMKSMMKSVTLPEGISEIGDSAFDGCFLLEKTDFPETLESIGEKAFLSCRRLESLDIPSSVEKIGKYAFYGCSGLTTVRLGKSLKDTGVNAFGACGSLKEVSADPDNLNFFSEDGVLFSKGKDALIYYPTGRQNEEYVIPASVKVICNFAFLGNSYLKSVILSDTVEIGDHAFKECKNLEHVEFGSNVRHIGANSFEKCESIKKIVIPEGAESLGYRNEAGVEHGAVFMDCSSLSEILLPSTLKNIYIRCFSGCASLTKIKFGGDEAGWKKIYIGEDNEELKNAGIIYSRPSE